MALYHFSAKIISRANGESACAAAAYRSGEDISNEYDGITYDYRNKMNVELSVIMLPENAPEDFSDREILWNTVEKNEKQANAQLAREFEFSLPRELPPEVQNRIAMEFIQEHLVDAGMIVDVNRHNPPRMNSKKQPVDAEGKVTKDPAKFIYDNPHIHAQIPLRPLDENGHFMIKRQKIYVCEKEGVEGRFTAEELKKNPGWEKLYNYTDSSGKKSWHTKSYVENHPEESLTLVNRYPKSETKMNPIVERWNSTEMLLELREAWAVKVNEAYEEYGMEERVDHRSYETQGIDLIPTVHEGKSVTIEEKRLKEEYEEKIFRGEEAFLKHTDIRNLNNAIREHNQEIRIIMYMKKLREQMEKIMAPVKIRIVAFEQSFAEKLERLRAEIVCFTIKIRTAVNLKNEADQQLSSNKKYIKHLEPVRKERIEELKAQKRILKQQINSFTGLFSGKKREELTERIESLDREISILIENRKYAIDAEKEIAKLNDISEKAGQQIQMMQDLREEKIEEYANIKSEIIQEDRESIQMERISIRPGIESQYWNNKEKREFEKIAQNIDKKLDGAPINSGRSIRISFE